MPRISLLITLIGSQSLALGARPRPLAPLRTSVRAPPPTLTTLGWEEEGVPAPRDPIDWFCRSVNTACRASVLGPFRAAAAIQQSAAVNASDASPSGFSAFLATVTSSPSLPPLSRPTWLVIAASLPTALGFYGWYKFCTEEELYWEELRSHGRASGCGGYGTLLPFVYATLLGGGGTLAGVPHADALVEFGSAWILLSQINLYKRVNELCEEAGDEAPLHAWWALLPPPVDLIVGLRQLHFLARRNAAARGEAWRGDAIAEDLFPFISAPRFTLKELAQRPSGWFWFTKGVPDLDLAWLPKRKV